MPIFLRFPGIPSFISQGWDNLKRYPQISKTFLWTDFRPEYLVEWKVAIVIIWLFLHTEKSGHEVLWCPVVNPMSSWFTNKRLSLMCTALYLESYFLLISTIVLIVLELRPYFLNLQYSQKEINIWNENLFLKLSICFFKLTIKKPSF